MYHAIQYQSILNYKWNFL